MLQLYVVFVSFLVASACAINCLERFVSEVTCYVSSGTLNPTHSHSSLALVVSRLSFCRHVETAEAFSE